MKRLFLALPPSGEEAQLLWNEWESLRFSSPGVRWVPPEQYHVTLIFFGSVETSLIPSICVVMDDVSKLYAPFKVRTDGPGQFPVRGNPRVFIEHLTEGAGPSGGNLSSLQTLLNQRLKGEFTLEKRRFKAHITTARVKRHYNAPSRTERLPSFESLSLTLNHMVLFESVLKPDSAVYNPLYNVRFEG